MSHEHISRLDAEEGVKPALRPFRYRRLKRLFFDEAWELEENLINDPSIDDSARHGAMANFYRMKAKHMRHNGTAWLYISMGAIWMAAISLAIAAFT